MFKTNRHEVDSDDDGSASILADDEVRSATFFSFLGLFSSHDDPVIKTLCPFDTVTHKINFLIKNLRI